MFLKYYVMNCTDYNVIFFATSNKTDEGERPLKAQPAWENSSLGFIEAVHQW